MNAKEILEKIEAFQSAVTIHIVLAVIFSNLATFFWQRGNWFLGCILIFLVLLFYAAMLGARRECTEKIAQLKEYLGHIPVEQFNRSVNGVRDYRDGRDN